MRQLLNLTKRMLTWLWTTRNGRITLLGMIAAAIPLLLLAGWLIRPLFVDTVVDEAFPLGADAAIPEQLTEDEARVMMSAASKLEIEVQESMTEAMSAGDPAQERCLRSTATPSTRAEGSATNLTSSKTAPTSSASKDFRVTNGPALFVLVSPHPNPEGRGDISERGVHRTRPPQGQRRQPELRPARRPRPRRHQLRDHLLQTLSESSSAPPP